MFKIRRTQTASGATAVQVVSYRAGRTNVLKHIGSARTDAEISALYDHARAYIEQHAGQSSLFPPPARERTLSLAHTRLRRTTHLFARSFFQACARVCGLSTLDPVVIDLAMMRIIEPSSKLRALELIERFFAIRYNKRIYGILRSLLSEKAAIESAALSCVRTVLKEDLFLIAFSGPFRTPFWNQSGHRSGVNPDTVPGRIRTLWGIRRKGVRNGRNEKERSL